MEEIASTSSPFAASLPPLESVLVSLSEEHYTEIEKKVTTACAVDPQPPDEPMEENDVGSCENTSGLRRWVRKVPKTGFSLQISCDSCKKMTTLYYIQCGANTCFECRLKDREGALGFCNCNKNHSQVTSRTLRAMGRTGKIVPASVEDMHWMKSVRTAGSKVPSIVQERKAFDKHMNSSLPFSSRCWPMWPKKEC